MLRFVGVACSILPRDSHCIDQPSFAPYPGLGFATLSLARRNRLTPGRAFFRLWAGCSSGVCTWKPLLMGVLLMVRGNRAAERYGAWDARPTIHPHRDYPNR